MQKLELYYPANPYYVNQAFGANGNPVYKTQGLKGHGGVDLVAKHGEPVYATHDGTCYPQIDDHGGNGVVIVSPIQYELPDKTCFIKTIYWHLIDDDAVVHTGQKVKTGDLIGYADSTGVSTGDHLHFGLNPCTAQGYDLDPFNGYGGGIDPVPFFNGKFASDINTPAHPIVLFYRTLKYGMWNPEVKKLQEILNKLNFPCGVTDGVFGKKTLEAVKQLQGSHQLNPDGIVGPKTMALLTKLIQ